MQYPKEISNAAKLEIAEFFQEFYQISDIPGEHNQYVDMFTSDATFILASKRAVGRNGMICGTGASDKTNAEMSTRNLANETGNVVCSCL